MAVYCEAINLDMTVPDYETKKIDARVMGTRNAEVSESQSANELFSYMSRYIQAREKLQK